MKAALFFVFLVSFFCKGAEENRQLVINEAPKKETTLLQRKKENRQGCCPECCKPCWCSSAWWKKDAYCGTRYECPRYCHAGACCCLIAIVGSAVGCLKWQP